MHNVIMFHHSDKPLNEGRVQHICSIPWEDPNVLDDLKKRKAEFSQLIDLQGYGAVLGLDT